jgi:hypothetical protein
MQSPVSLGNEETTSHWDPFTCEADFYFADFVTKCYLVNSQIDLLLQLLQSKLSDSSQVTFKTHHDLDKVLKIAVTKTTQVFSLISFVISQCS